ncbi:MAG: hypothetical protein EKK57_09745 [Proteobacteria bacterium]|nr:MAG: hypothetical protein EKK57_09745 [Pseudomonadota bacterium]
MERFSWLIGNVIALILGMTGLMYIFPKYEPAVQPSQVDTPEVLSVTSSEIEVTTFYYALREDAYNAFLLQYYGANVSSFQNVSELSRMGYKGYFAWYNKTLTTHTVLLKGTTVVVIKYIDTTVYGNESERLSRVEQYILEYLKEINEI